jgi:hypothetical protein
MNLPHAARQATVSRERHDEANTRLSGHWLVLARVTWVALVVYTLVLFFMGFLVFAAHVREVCTSTSTSWITSCRLGQLLAASAQIFHLSVDSSGVFTVALTLMWMLVWISVGAVIFRHRSDDWIALLVALTLVMGGIYETGLIGLSQLGWVGQFLEPFFQFLNNVIIILVAFLFPTGRFVPRWMRWLSVIIFVLFAFQAFLPDSPFNSNNWPSLLSTLTFLAIFGCMMFSQIHRYRRVSNSLQRQQTKWVIFAFSIYIVGICAEVLGLELLPQYFPTLRLPDALYQVFDTLTWQFSIILIPLSFGIAILRYRLWDIDVIINRTLVYGMLTVILTVVYVSLIIGLQALLHGIISQENSVAIVISTLAIAALFQPLRARIQQIIDRRFYRSKYDAGRIIDAFSTTLRAETDLTQLHEQLVAVVQETMQPAHVLLWLRPTEQDEKHRAPWWADRPVSSERR